MPSSLVLLHIVVEGLCVAGLTFLAGVGALSAVERGRPVVARWRDRRHVRRCWRAVR